MSPINVGVVGLSTEGWASLMLINPLLKAPLSEKYNLTALSTRSPSSASETATKYSELTKHTVKPFHGDTSQIAADKEVDFVVVAVKTLSHKEAVLPVIEASKNIFVEWPCGRGLQEAKEMMDAAQKKGIRTMVGLQGRQSPVVRKAKELVSSGKIGRVLSTSVILAAPQELNYWGPTVSERTSYTVDETSGATMLNIAVSHFLGSFIPFLGEFASVTATARNQYHEAKEVDQAGNPTGKILSHTSADQVAFSGVLKSGAVASIHCRGGPSTKARTSFIWTIDGEAGSIRLESDKAIGSFIHIDPPKLYLDGEEVKVEEGGDAASNISRAWSEFAKGPEGDCPTFEDAVRVHTALEAISRSAREGKRIELD